MLLAALLVITGSLAARQKPAVPFIENDYTAALAAAQKRNVQLFVDLWAPW